MIFFGASGHAKAVIETWVTSGGKVSKVFDDNDSIETVLGYPVSSLYKTGDFDEKDIFISIGSNSARKRIANLLSAKSQSIIHPSSVISTSVKMGYGCVAMAGVVVNSSSTIGNHVILNTGSIVEHDCRLDDFTHISPHVTLCGGVQVGEGAHVGAGATVIQNIRIGQWAVIGAGSVIIKDVPDFAVVVGVPGKVIKSVKN